VGIEKRKKGKRRADLSLTSSEVEDEQRKRGIQDVYICAPESA
jgi:hypothetical protein